MKKILLIIVFAIGGISLTSISAQEYDLATGVRVGKGIFLNLKKTIRDDISIEFFTGVNSLKHIDYYAIGALLQIHNELGVDRLYWYYGGGATVAFKDKTHVGLTFNTGIDYSLDNLPINISFDYAPILSFREGLNFDWTNVGVSLRYILRD